MFYSAATSGRPNNELPASWLVYMILGGIGRPFHMERAMKLTVLMDYLGKVLDKKSETISYTTSVLRFEYFDKAVENKIWKIEEGSEPPVEHQRILAPITSQENKIAEMVGSPYKCVSLTTGADTTGCRTEWQSSESEQGPFQTITEDEGRWFEREGSVLNSELQFLGGKSRPSETYFRRIVFRGDVMVEASNVLSLTFYPSMNIAISPETVFNAEYDTPYDVTFPLPNVQQGTVHKVEITHLSTITNVYMPAGSFEMDAEHVSGYSYQLNFHSAGVWEFRVFAELKVLDEESGELLSAAAYGPLKVRLE